MVVLAGPNGSGKSTIAASLLSGVPEFVDADVLSRGVRASSPQATAMRAGRAMLSRLDVLGAAGQSFGFETTLASRSFAPRIRGLFAAGYEFHLVFLWLPSVELALLRVAGRVRLGGHDVPAAVIRRRYAAGLRNFFDLYQPLTKTWRMYDNSSSEPVLIAVGQGHTTVNVTDPVLWEQIKAGRL